MNGRRFLWTIAIGVLVVGLGPARGVAKEVKATGSVTYIPMSTETDKLPDGRTINRSHIKGIILSDNPKVSTHKSTQDCYGTTVIGSKGLEISSGYCDARDQKGDLWFIWWRQTPASHDWGFVGGTGKYDGIQGGGTAVADPPNLDGSFVLQWKGAWTIR